MIEVKQKSCFFSGVLISKGLKTFKKYGSLLMVDIPDKQAMDKSLLLEVLMYDLSKEFAFGPDCTDMQRTEERVFSIQWMIKVLRKLEGENGVVHLAVSLLGKILTKDRIQNVQVLSASCFIIASKYLSSEHPSIEEIAHEIEEPTSTHNLILMEITILEAINFT